MMRHIPWLILLLPRERPGKVSDAVRDEDYSVRGDPYGAEKITSQHDDKRGKQR